MKLKNKDAEMLEYKKQVDCGFRSKQANLEANKKSLTKKVQILELENKFIKVFSNFSPVAYF